MLLTISFVGLIIQCNAAHKKTPALQENNTGLMYVLLKNEVNT